MLKTILHYINVNRWRLIKISKNNFLIYCSVFVGLMGGLAAVALKYLVHFMEDLSRNIGAHVPFHFMYIFLPALGILLTILYQHLVNRDQIQKGIGTIIFNIKRNKANMKFNNVYSHLITSSLTVGFGGSSGLEAPIVSTGAAIGSVTGRFFKLTTHQKSLLIAAGASAGIAAVFNSPIAGVLFSLEILLGEISIPTFIPLLIASATGVVVAKILYSRQLFHLATEGWHLQALPFYLLLGLLSGWTAIYISNVAHKLEKGIFKKQNRYVRAVLGGLILGVIILIFPPLLGEGYHYLQEVLNGNINVLQEESLFSTWLQHPLIMAGFIAALVFMKVIAAGITLGSGGNGGTFAPTMFTGAFLGLFVAYAVNLTGWVHLNTSNFIAVGMAGALSGVLHAPLTAIFLIAEITGGYILFIPLMIVSAISYIIARLSNSHNMYWHDLIHEKNVRPDKDYEMLTAIEIRKVVNRKYTAVKRNRPIKELYKLMAETSTNIFAVLDDEKHLQGVVLLDELRKRIVDGTLSATATIEDLMIEPPAVIEYNQSAEDVMDLFDTLDVWQLPVVYHGRFVGFVSKSNMLTEYRKVLIGQHHQPDPFGH
ncbi:chloride channel protein [Mucilaginibacter sp. KACC 22063]|uniref:chloride channel protein n=1 Tax=Mucilaginibacter sp. KACC 22063 TaxID=3025666 RepID=UPI0023669212|nr:chloride channel protein [Mucilaginibacter sp. KACC 22063]WDF57009.1 chloride channel protein [Mucilaginibacter sp. KACC 22063]